MGETQIDAGMFMEYLQAQGTDRFRGDRSQFKYYIFMQCFGQICRVDPCCRYDLLNHNCNNFSHETCQFLTGKGIPQHILDLPREVVQQMISNNKPCKDIIKFLSGDVHPDGPDVGTNAAADEPNRDVNPILPGRQD